MENLLFEKRPWYGKNPVTMVSITQFLLLIFPT